MKQSVQKRVREELSKGPLTLTCTVLCRKLRVRSDTMSSALRRMVKKKVLVLVPNFGPRGGNGYRLPTAYEAVTEHIAEASARTIAEEIDKRVLAELYGFTG